MSRVAIILSFAILVMALLAACNSNSRSERGKRNEQAIGTQQILAESGFLETMLDTPEKVANARDLPQRQVIRRGAGNTGNYVYIDVALCGCMYTGNANAYKRYMQRIEQQAARANNYQAQQLQLRNQKIIRPIGRYD